MQPNLAFTFVTAALAAAVLRAQNHVVAPASATANDAMSYEWVAGASRPLRQQTLVGGSHLAALQNRLIQAIELRRHAAPEAYLPGTATLTVTLSVSPNSPLTCSNRFADNPGPNAVQVFTGPVAFPASPATGGSGSPVAWTAANTIRIAFAQPFLYTQGTLCVDVVGAPIPGQEANWWMADAIEEVLPGAQAVEVGAGCGVYGGPQRRWSQVATRSLVPSGRGIFRAEGPANGLALAVFGAAAPQPIPLSFFGIPTPNCNCHLDPALTLAAVLAVFEPETHPLSTIGASAEVLLQIPASSVAFGLQMTTQWFDLTQLATSNAISWTVANAIPTIDMALVEGHPAGDVGNATTWLAPVLRFEYQ
jgi:hypothetical protein